MNRKKIESLEALKYIDKNCPSSVEKKYFEVIKNELKVLDIIKTRFTIRFTGSDVKGYYGVMWVGFNPIYIKKKEEFDLLQKVLL